MEHILLSRPFEWVMQVTINRPEALNALSRATVSEIGRALREADDDPSVRSVVITGDERSFSVGSDIKEMPESDMPMWAETTRLTGWKSIEGFSKPLIAAVNGYCLGGGCELMLHCDIVILGDSARIGLPEIKIAAFPGGGGSQRLPRAVGKTRAMMMMMTGDPLDAGTALSWGLGTELVEADRTVPRALEIARKISEMSPLAIRMVKAEVLMTYQKPLDESLSLERKLLLWQSEDHDEGIAAFMEKRKPVFKGR